MKRSSVVSVSLIAAVVGGCLIYERNTGSAKPPEIINGLQAPLNLVSINVDRQKKCDEEAREQFRGAGWDRNPRARFADHYSEALRSCFIEFDLIITSPDGAADHIRSLSNSRGREYATYAQAASGSGGESSKTPPTVCEVALPAGEQIDCSSLEQFKEYTKGYMGNAKTTQCFLTARGTPRSD